MEAKDVVVVMRGDAKSWVVIIYSVGEMKRWLCWVSEVRLICWPRDVLTRKARRRISVFLGDDI